VSIDVCLLCVGRKRVLRRADHSSRVVLPSVMCLSVIVET
jgi:predicted DCC family thiol-disulfide oxidoreductase YuxK